ncbi:hypothetical protein L2E82_35654 [Cichorium intybus]|uniref:Uncharacterized protein n=1 Tax=Cichorium intybus TaxID=13427 RepID=A0ACB9BPI0_CICIN|nr:hypothetical protein L2E82_35654 [Cichorium intybus]
MENRSHMENLSDAERNFLREEGTSLSFNQIPLLESDPFMDEYITNSGIIPMNQGFMAGMQNDDQLQVIYNDSVGMNPEFEGGFQYQDHFQMIQRNLEGFQNPGFIAKNQQLLPTADSNVIAPNFIFGLTNQDHAQMIQNDNSTTGFDSLNPRATVIGSESGSRQPLSKEEIAQHFNKPLMQTARELNVGSTQLKQRCRKLGIKSWPQRQIKSLQTLINHTQESDNNPSRVDVILGLENEKRAIVEGSSSKITDTTKRLRQAAFKAVYKKRKVQKREEASSGTHTQQQSLPSVSAMSGFNHDFLKTISVENPEDLAGDIAAFDFQIEFLPILV